MILKKYDDSSEEELFKTLESYGVNVQEIKSVNISLEELRDFVSHLDDLLEVKSSDASSSEQNRSSCT